MHSTSLLIFLKAPRTGTVKTRLAKSIGGANACTVYQALVKQQLADLNSNLTPQVHFTPSDALPEMQAWLGDNPQYQTQIEGGLGERLIHAIDQAFAQGASTCLCIGGDCPKLQSEQIDAALQALADGADVVFGPCDDGGYYLVGLNRPLPSLFTEIPWSAPDTLAVTLEKAQELDLSIHLLETLYDVDDLEGLKRAIDEGYLSPTLLPSNRLESD